MSTATQAPSLVEELVLLVVEDDGGIAFTAGTPGFGMAVIGGCLVELNLVGAIDADLDGIRVLDASPGRGTALDLVLREVAAGPEARVEQWVVRLFPHAQEIIRAALASLIQRGILAQSERRFLWVLKERSYPMRDDRELKEAKRRIYDTLMSDIIPSPHDTVLLGLALAGGLLEAFLSKAEIARLEDRIREAGGIDLIVRGVEAALRQDQLVRAQAMLYPF
jgi:hypothetical protein